MFEIGDYVLNATNGICKINEIVELDMSGDKNLKSYFLLRPIDEENDKVYIPVDNADKRIRKVINKDQAIAIIEKIPEIEELEIANEKERETKYKTAIRSCEPEQIISLLKCLRKRSQERMSQGKRNTAVDERYTKMAVNNFHAELAFALGRDKKEMDSVIEEMLAK